MYTISYVQSAMESDRKCRAMKKCTSLLQEGVKRDLKFSSRKVHTHVIAPGLTGIEYPLDLWFLISEYILPEAVATFACICKSSYQVVQTGKFWFHLYKRFYKPVLNLPERLQPECMVRLRGLRACVIRALHFTYFPIFHEVNGNKYFVQGEPHALVNRQCVLMWHKKGISRWYLFLKLKKIDKKQINNQIHDRTDIFYILDNVLENPEENCRLLRIACLNYQMVPLATGLVLQHVKLDLSPGFGHYRLQLSFGNTYTPKVPTQILILGGVIDCKVLDWWHPCYPH